jgi:hypothetical protein
VAGRVDLASTRLSSPKHEPGPIVSTSRPRSAAPPLPLPPLPPLPLSPPPAAATLLLLLLPLRTTAATAPCGGDARILVIVVRTLRCGARARARCAQAAQQWHFFPPRVTSHVSHLRHDAEVVVHFAGGADDLSVGIQALLVALCVSRCDMC